MRSGDSPLADFFFKAGKIGWGGFTFSNFSNTVPLIPFLIPKSKQEMTSTPPTPNKDALFHSTLAQ